jgi:hypothetical protein
MTPYQGLAPGARMPMKAISRLSILIALLCGATTASMSAATPEDPAASACQVHISMTPPDAVVAFDGVITNSSPLIFSNLNPGDHLLVAQKPGYRELRQTITLTPGQRLPLQLTMEPLVGLVIIHSEPPEADVQIDGAHRGKTPLLLADIPIGKYRVKILKSGFQTKDVDLVVSDRTPKKLLVPLSSDSADLTISSVPDGANVRINGLDKGKTPCAIDRIPQGSINVEVTMEGYEPYSEPVRLAAGEKQQVKVALKPIPSELSVVSIPVKARIYVNNEFKGEAPVTIKNLPPGSYRIRAELPDRETVARTVELKRASKSTEEFRLEGNTGAIHLTTEPPEVTVFIDGKQVGITPAKKEGAEQISDVLKIENIATGKREISFSRKRYADISRPVEIEKGKTLTLNQALKRKFTPDFEVRTPNGVFLGELEWEHAGSIKLQVAPGVYKVIPAEQVRSKRPLSPPDSGK